MAKNKSLSVIAGALVLCGLACSLSGCIGKKEWAAKDSSLSKEEVISRVKEQILNDCGAEVEVEILSKENQKTALFYLDGPCFQSNIKGVYQYSLRIIGQDGSESSGMFYEAHNSKNGYVPEHLIYDYPEKKALDDVKYKFERALEKAFSEYYIYQDISNPKGLDVFVCSDSADKAKDILNSCIYITEMAKDKDDIYVSYNIYVYKDEKAFESIDFDKYESCTGDRGKQSRPKDILEQLTGKNAEELAYSKGFDSEFFETNGIKGADGRRSDADISSFEYVVFSMYGEPNLTANGYDAEMEVFGIS